MPGLIRGVARTAAIVFSIAWLDFSMPYFACSVFTASGVSLADSRIGPLPSLPLAQSSALPDTSSPRQIASVSSARCGPLKALIWPSVAAEQEPARTAAAAAAPQRTWADGTTL